MPRKKAPPAPPEVTNLDDARSIIKVLWDRLNDLEERLKQNSRNSSRPPSSDGLNTMPPPARKSRGKLRGAQPGHKGSKRQMVEQVDNTYAYYPDTQCLCGGDMTPASTPYRQHQVFDIPAQAFSVDEHQLFSATCTRCGDTQQGKLPDTVSSTQMGPNLLAYIAVQAGQFHQSVSKTQQQLEQNFGLHFSRGAISQAQGRVSAMLTPAYHQIKQQLLSSPIIHADETRHKRGGENRWMWQACTDSLSCFMVHYSRGQQAAKQLLGEDVDYVVVTDQYAGYHYIEQSKRQLCWAHILRNIAAIAQSWGTNEVIGKRLECMVHLLFRIRHRYEQGDITEHIYRRRMLRLQTAWRAGLAQGVKDCYTARYQNRCALLLKHDEMCWTFLTDEAIPLTNNEAERSLRSYVLWRKGSYGVWSHRGEQFRQRILTIVESCRKLGANPLQWLRAIVRSVIEKTQYPSLPELDALSQ